MTQTASPVDSPLTPALLGLLAFTLLAIWEHLGEWSFSDGKIDLLTALALCEAAFFLLYLARGGGRPLLRMLLLLLAAAGLLASAGELGARIEIAPGALGGDGILKLLCWLAMGPALAFFVSMVAPPRRVRLALALGLGLQTLSMLIDLTDGVPFRLPGVGPATLLTWTELSQLLFVSAYLSALLMLYLRPAAWAKPRGALNRLRRVSYGGRAMTWLQDRALLLQSPLRNLGYVAWAARRRGSFADYYVHRTLATINRDARHYTLGAELKRPETGRATAEDFVSVLRRHGLRPDHCCVEFGCGSLRMAEPVMRLLDPDRYIGLDVTDAFYSLGLQRLDPDLVARARPRFAVIGEDSLARIARERPDFVFCVLVLHHVPPFELDAFFGNLTRLVGERTICLLEARLAGRTRQTRRYVWIHRMDELRARLAPLGYGIEVLERFGAKGDRYWLRIRRCPGQSGLEAGSAVLLDTKNPSRADSNG